MDRSGAEPLPFGVCCGFRSASGPGGEAPPLPVQLRRIDRHREYFKKNLVIIGTPSNSFHQELSNNEEVKEFCLVNYETKFIISEIISVVGEDAHPIYSWMTSEYNETPKWNFYKYLFDGEGQLVKSWSSMTKPDSSKITNLIDELI